LTLIETPDAPPCNGHYSQAVVTGGLVFLSHQLPLVPGSPGLMPEGLEAQVRQVIANCEVILRAAGSGLDRVISASVQVTDMAGWPVVDMLWAEAFGLHRPARGVTAVVALHLDALVAVQMTAAIQLCNREDRDDRLDE
jgi:2-iminobutanoate/2-iminopropanoate deaminase